MTDFEKIDKCRNILLTRLFEPELNELVIEINLGSESEEAADLIIGNLNIGPTHSVNFDNSNERFLLYFGTCVSYCVTNASYEMGTTGKFSGDSIREYTESFFIDFCKKTTFAFQVLNANELRHYEILTVRHIINVLSTGSLTIKRIP